MDERKEMLELLSCLRRRAEESGVLGFFYAACDSLTNRRLTFKKLRWLEPNDLLLEEWKILIVAAQKARTQDTEQIVNFCMGCIKRLLPDSPA